MDTLFKMPKKVLTQSMICRKCKHSFCDEDIGYCNKFDLSIEFDGGITRHANGGNAFTCNERMYKDAE